MVPVRLPTNGLIRLGAASLIAAALAACVGGADPPRPPSQAETPAASAPAGRQTIGTGSVKLALVVPLTGQGAEIGTALRNAAELAYDEFQKPDLTILVKDDRGTPEGAREAAKAALDEGAELVFGPLFAANVLSVGGVARAAGKPVIAFSTDATVAARGVYLISFLPLSEVDRIVDETTAGGRRSFAELIPDNSYGNAVEAQFREAVARKGARLVGVERYAPADPGPAVGRLSKLIAGPGAQADALFLPGTADAPSVVAPALTKAGFVPGRVRPVGTAAWNDLRILELPALQGGQFAAPDTVGFDGFSQRYQARYGSAPPRAAALGYDAVSLSSVLMKQYGSQRFTDATLTNPAGFAGLDGIFRFRPEGTSERALAVYEVRGGSATRVSPAPKALGPSGI